MDDPHPVILMRGSLSPSTISLSSPDLDSTTFTLDLELSLRNSIGPMTVWPTGSFLSSNAQGWYSSDYCLYDTETESECNKYRTTCCFPSEHVIIKNPEEELLEIGTSSTGESSTNETPADTHPSRNSSKQKAYQQLPVHVKVDIGIHYDRALVKPKSTTPKNPTEKDGAAENETNPSDGSQSQPEQRISNSDLSICATALKDLVPGRQYQVRHAYAPGRGPHTVWWWSPGSKAEIVANRDRRGPHALVGPLTDPSTGEAVYVGKRVTWSTKNTIMAEMLECPVLTVTA